MKRKNLKVALLQFGGAEFTTTEMVDGKEVKKPVMISDQIGQVLWQVANSELSPEEKYKAFKIAQRIAATPEAVELSSEEVAMIKKMIAPVFAAGVYGQMVDVLEK